MRRREAARKMKASLESVRNSSSLPRRRKLPSQPKVRSTTQRRGSTTKPFCRSLRRTISMRRGALAEALLHPAGELVAGVAAVGPVEFEFGERFVDLIQHERGPIAVLHVGGVDAHLEDQAIGIHQQMAFASHDLLARIVAAHSAPASRAHALAVQDRGRGGFFLPLWIRAASRSAP